MQQGRCSYSGIFLGSIVSLACVTVSWSALLCSRPAVSLSFSQEQEPISLKHKAAFCRLAPLHSRAVCDRQALHLPSAALPVA